MISPAIQWSKLPARRLVEGSELAERWDQLNAERLDLPLLSAYAVCAALVCFGTGSEFLLIARRSDKIVAIFVLQKEGTLRWRTFQPSQLPLGPWVASPDLALVDLTRDLINRGLRCLVLSLMQIDPLMSTRVADGARNRHDDYIATAWIDITGTFADYWDARGKNLRQNMRKQRSKLQADGMGTVMRRLSDKADVQPALQRYGALEASGWKAEQGTAIHPDNVQGSFFRKLLEEAAERSELQIFEYLFDETTVAMNLCLLRHSKLIVLKTAYDASIKSLSPAFMLREDELKAIFSEGQICRIEYYGRVMDWHTKLTEESRTLHHLTVYRWSWLKRLAERRRKATSGTNTNPEIVE